MSMLTGNRAAGFGALVPAMQQRNEFAITPYNEGSLVSHERQRCSNLQAPIMLLTGHEGEIYSAKFHPEGKILASAGHERLIYMWEVYGDCDNYHVIKGGHNGAILDLKFSTDGSSIFTASTDKTVGMFDTETGARVKRMKGHNAIVNSCASTKRGDQLVASASDDCTVKIWDTRWRAPVKSLQLTYQVTAVCFDDTSANVIVGGIDNDIKMFDIRAGKMSMQLSGHTDTVTGVALNSDGSYLLTNSMDCTLRVWDIRPYAPQERCIKVFTGHQHNFEKNLLKCSWSPDDSKVACGSADRDVCVWHAGSLQMMYKLPGHAGSVNDVQFHPLEPIVMSCSSDKQIYLGELEK